MAAGIDDISIYIPRLYLDAGDFAKARGLDPDKLERGLGIGQMAIVDTNQDPACLAANAAHCANDQGMFWQFHSTLYNNWAGEGTGWISSEQLNKFANTLELDMDEFSN